MPEPPDFDFDYWARQVCAGVVVMRDGLALPAERAQALSEAAVVSLLKMIWNARGAADIADLDHTFSAGVSPSMKVIDQIIRALDR